MRRHPTDTGALAHRAVLGASRGVAPFAWRDAADGNLGGGAAR